jgi:HK97 gp10 family phage protein
MTGLASADVSRLAEALRRTADQSGVTTQQVLISGANYIKAEMESRVPVDTGNLRESIGIKVLSDRVIIGPDAVQAPYAIYVEEGTKPHLIKPKSPGGTLRFVIDGQVVYAKSVQHPGTKAQPFIVPAFMAWVDTLGTLAAEANVEVFRKYAS